MEAKTQKTISAIFGGWSPYEPVTINDVIVFEEAIQSIVSTKYRPLLVSKQVVSGTNYKFKCEASIPPSETIWEATVEIFQPLDGPPYVKRHRKPFLELSKQIAIDTTFAKALEASIIKAKENAKEKLNQDLYKAINLEFNGNGWPENSDQYIAYLTHYSELIPNEISSEEYPYAWTSDGTKNGHNQKIFDILCQFYFLIDQKITVNSETIILQNYKNLQTGFDFANWISDFNTLWGVFLNTSPSLTRKTLNSFREDPPYHLSNSSQYIDSWTCFNDFFYRQLNGANPMTGISPLRPITKPNNNTTICSPADCTYKQNYSIDANGNIPDITLKHTHSVSSISELLDGSPNANDFNNGTFAHYFLSPFDYHRFHTPVSGTILECKAVVGKAYLNVILQDDGQFDAPDGAENGYEFTQARGVVIMDTHDDNIGKVAILPIGMAQVSSVHMYTELKDQHVCKGFEFGKFAFGGSDIIMLFEKNPSIHLEKYDTNGQPIHFKYGEASVLWNKNE